MQVMLNADHGKFVVLLIKKGELVIYSEFRSHHCELVDEFFRQTGLKTQCVGGGKININEDKKTIRIWDSSNEFGIECDRAATIAAISKAYPNFEVYEYR